MPATAKVWPLKNEAQSLNQNPESDSEKKAIAGLQSHAVQILESKLCGAPTMIDSLGEAFKEVLLEKKGELY